MNDPYKILGVSYTATDAEIKKAYHALARRYHPDNFASDPVRLEMANRKMRDINEAYSKITEDREKGISPEANSKPPEREEPPYAHAQKREEAEEEPKRARKEKKEKPKPPDYTGIRTMIDGESYAVALSELSRIHPSDRGAEWHYLAGRCHLGMRHLHDAFREVNEACRRDRRNAEHKKTRDEMKRTAAGFDKAAGRTRRRDAEIRTVGKVPKKDGFLKKSFLRAIGMEDGKC